jgi:hypothetical protein
MPAKDTSPVRIGLALGGGFARGIAHAGVLQVLERHRIPIHCIAGISAGAIVAAAYASGTTPAEIAAVGCSMRFGDVGALRPGRLGLVRSACMGRFIADRPRRLTNTPAGLQLSQPKSNTLITSSGVIFTLDGLRSRWTTPRSCAVSMASAICRAVASASGTGMGPMTLGASRLRRAREPARAHRRLLRDRRSRQCSDD